MDKLIEKQHFEFKRPQKKNGKIEFTKIACKIRCLRSDSFKEHLARKEAKKHGTRDDGSVVVRITGCEYKTYSPLIMQIVLSYFKLAPCAPDNLRLIV